MKKWIIIFLLLAQIVSGKNYTLRDADRLFQNNQFYEALTIYKALEKKTADKQNLLYKQALCYLKINSPDTAVRILEKLKEGQDAAALKSYQKLADFYINRSLFDKAENLLTEARRKFPDNKRLIDSLLFVYKNQSDYQNFKKLMENPAVHKTQDLYYQLIDLGIGKDKKQDVKQQIESVKNNALREELLAYYYRKTNQFDKAENIYQSLYSRTKRLFYIEELAHMYDEKGDRNKAQNIILSVLRKNDINSYTQIVHIFYQFAYYKKAIALYKEMEQKFGKNYSEQLIELYQLTYDYKNLVKEYLRYMKINHDVAYASEKLSDLVFIDGQEKIVFDLLNQELKKPSGIEPLYIHRIFFNIYERKGDALSAEKELLWLVSHRSDSVFLKAAVNRFIVRGWLNSAESVLEDIIRKNYNQDKQNDFLFFSAEVEFALGHYLKSLEILDNLPPSDRVLYYKSVNLNYLGEYEKEFRTLKKISDVKGTVLIEKALNSILRNDFEAGLKFCQSAVKEKEVKNEALFIKSYIYLMQDKWEDAADVLKLTVQAGNASYYNVEALQEIYIIENLFEKQTNSLIKKEYSDSIKKYIGHHYNAAAAGFQKLKIKLPEYSYFWDYQMGDLYFLSKQYDLSIRAFSLVENNEQALDYFRASAAEKIAVINRILNKSSESLSAYRSILMRFPWYVRQKEIRESIMKAKNGKF